MVRVVPPCSCPHLIDLLVQTMYIWWEIIVLGPGNSSVYDDGFVKLRERRTQNDDDDDENDDIIMLPLLLNISSHIAAMVRLSDDNEIATMIIYDEYQPSECVPSKSWINTKLNIKATAATHQTAENKTTKIGLGNVLINWPRKNLHFRFGVNSTSCLSFSLDQHCARDPLLLDNGDEVRQREFSHCHPVFWL